MTYYHDLQQICNKDIKKMIFRNLQTNLPHPPTCFPPKKKILREVFQQAFSIPPFIEKDTKVSSNLVIIQEDIEKYLDLKAKCK